MARFTRLNVLNTILDIGLLPLFYHAETETAIEIVSALVKGGAQAVEFTNRGEKAYSVFTELVRHFERADPSVILGVGSIVDAPTAALFIASGANFIVSPSFHPEIVRLCNRRKIAYLPGCATETEIANAEEFGAEIIKVFPGETIGGPRFIRAVMAPCPWHRLMPSGGVDASEADVAEWIKAGAAALGMGSKLVTPQAIKARDFDGIREKTAQVISWIRQARTLT